MQVYLLGAKVMERHVLSVLVKNSSGVLTRVSGLFARRGFNIDSLTVGRTENPEISRMTITLNGNEDVLKNIEDGHMKMYLDDIQYICENESKMLEGIS